MHSAKIFSCKVLVACLAIVAGGILSCRTLFPVDTQLSGLQHWSGVIDVGQTRDGELAAGGMVHYTVSVAAPMNIIIDARTAPGSLCDPQLELQDAMGTVLARDDNSGGGMDARLGVFLNPGRYAISLKNNGNRPGSCSLSVARGADIAPHRDPVNQAPAIVKKGAIHFDESKNGNLNTNEAHAYDFTIQEAQTVTIDMKSDGSPLDSYLKLVDSGQQILAEDDDGGGGLDSRIVHSLGQGTYTIIAHPFGSSSGSYRLSLTRGVPQVPQKTVVEKGDLSVGRRIDGFIGPMETHRYSLKIAKKESLAIDANQISQNMDPILELRDTLGTVIARDDDGGGGRNATINRVLEKGEYKVDVFSYGNNGGPYRLYVSRVEIEEQKHTTIEPGVVRESFLGPVDSHRYSFSVKKQGMAEINLMSADSALDPFVELHSGDGRVLGQDDDGGNNMDSKLFYYVEPGEYVIIAKPYGSSSGRYRLTMDLKDVIPQQFTEITTGVTREGFLLPGKIHRYDFRLKRDALVSIDAIQVMPNCDPMLSLLDGTGEPLANDDDSGGGRNARVFRDLKAGNYRIDVIGYGNSLGTYKLSVAELEKKTISPGSVREGILGEGGSHIYSFELNKQGLVTIDHRRMDDSQLDPLLALISQDKGIVARDDDSGGNLNSRIMTILEAGRYYIAVSGLGTAGGKYSLALERKDVPPPISARVRVGDISRGSILYPSQRDRYTFVITSAEFLTITASSDNSNLDTFLEVHDSQGNMVASDDDGGNGTNSIIRTQFMAGTYIVTVRSYSSSTGAYIMTIGQ